MLTAKPGLADLRREIDRIDEAMHRLLMERGDIIQTLIRVKGTGESGQAFRPGREAEMMRRLAERHHGLLPLDTAESIWRVIIATFTFVQAHYAVHVDISGGDSPIRDSARFHFGFTPPLMSYAEPDRVIAAIARSAGDLGLVRAEDHVSAGAWWRALEAPDAPKIIARLPFIERRDHPAGLPVFVLARPLKDAAVRETVVFSVAEDRNAIEAQGGHVLETAIDFNGDPSHLVAVDGAKAAAFDAALGSSAFEIGSHAERYQALMSQHQK
jgi:chorismate mutase